MGQAGRFGFNETTPDKLQLDAGEFWANFDIEAFLADAQDETTDVTDLSSYGLGDNPTATRLGATDGAGSFEANRDRNSIDFDGKLGRTKGMERRGADGVNPQLVAPLMEFSEENMTMAVFGARVNELDDPGVTGVIEITGGEIRTTDYIDNVVFIGKRSDGKPIIFEVRNCLSETFGFDPDHGSEGTVEITFQAHFDVEECTFDAFGGREWVEPWRLVMYADA